MYIGTLDFYYYKFYQYESSILLKSIVNQLMSRNIPNTINVLRYSIAKSLNDDIS